MKTFNDILEPRIGATFLVVAYLTLLGSGTAMATPVIYENSLGSELTDLTTEDDEEQDVSLSFLFPFAGSTYGDISVSTNGVIGLGGSASFTCCPDVSDDDLLNEDQPTISPFWSDMDLDEMGMVFFNDFGDRAVITWDEIGSFEDEDAPFTFQVQLLDDGTIIFAYNGISVDSSGFPILDADLVVGISPALGATDPGESDYSVDIAFSGGTSIYEIFEETSEVFDLDMTNICYVPNGNSGFDVTDHTGPCSVSTPPAPAPEPTTIMLLGLGLAGLGFTRRRLH